MIEAEDGKVFNLRNTTKRRFTFDHFSLECKLHFEDSTGQHVANIPDLRACLSNILTYGTGGIKR